MNAFLLGSELEHYTKYPPVDKSFDDTLNQLIYHENHF